MVVGPLGGELEHSETVPQCQLGGLEAEGSGFPAESTAPGGLELLVETHGQLLAVKEGGARRFEERVALGLEAQGRIRAQLRLQPSRTRDLDEGASGRRLRIPLDREAHRFVEGDAPRNGGRLADRQGSDKTKESRKENSM